MYGGIFTLLYRESKKSPHFELNFSRIFKGLARWVVVSQDIQNHPGSHLETFDEAFLFGNGHHADVLVIKLLVSGLLVVGQATAEISFLLGTLAEKRVELTALLDAALDRRDSSHP